MRDVHYEWKRGHSWTTRDGLTIPIVALNDEHLCNIARMLLRNWLLILYCHGVESCDVRAAIAADDDRLAVYLAIFREVQRRGLHTAEPGQGGGHVPNRPDVFDVIDP